MSPWYDPISTIISLTSKKPTDTQWYAALQALIDKIESMCLDLVDVSTTHRGLCPQLDGNATHFLRSDGVQAVPAGTGIGLGGATGDTDEAILLADGVSTDTIKTSNITIETTLTDDDTKVPTSGAVSDALTGKAATTRKLDDFGPPDDNTDLDASTSAHGLVLKATAPASGIRNVICIDNGETAYKNAALFDDTDPENNGTASPGTSLIAARRDHVHASSGSGGVTFAGVSGTTQQAAVNNGYIPLNAALTTITLPATAAVGDVVAITGYGAGLWKLAQNTSQLIHFLSLVTTTGTGGYIQATTRYDTIIVRCVEANTTWVVENAVGNLDVI